MSRGRRQSHRAHDAAEIFSDAEFDAEDFVDQMDERKLCTAAGKAGWRRLEALRDERLLREQLDDYTDWDLSDD